ncbi:hypothetical protein ACFVR1_11350 [Psychrobacillus sp. NPDC058041]|uniref:hypothetical protein n=1 Tax=Psychrobacillus sp. NPDC058041 TaxID=3346310 RepID=UPI0036D931D9
MNHNTLHQRQKEHSERVKAFHRNHEIEIQLGKNGNSLLAKWERFFYNNVISPLKNAK